eukprot:CAMPEP_0194396744 /NCGR_PEP_ID=MMETSP0174-20130528/125159_1 /TAXON_ID=216777 /ORGANISM="Proboscia alata, Strain PI-D3" /LENGTH=480 /DNA_ID=CAMNT_0039192845 /DNA_START=1993 /DNA_END=3435 /DNA_ORIENTATION=-
MIQKLLKPRVVILGSGWAGNTLARRLRKDLFDVRLISPANHFLFTPLLPSTAVGTLEFRAIEEPVRTIPGLGEYYQAKARTLDSEQKFVRCQDVFKGNFFDVKYDYLCIAAGSKTNTFNTPGVAEKEGKEVFFLKHLHHARQIRNRVLECFERATNPNISDFERRRLLSFVVVGGGPTSCEFTAELHDFLKKDVRKWYPDIIDLVKITLVEAGPGILGSFDMVLAEYYLESLREKEIDVRINTAVVGIEDRYMDNKDDDECQLDEGHHHYTVAKLADGDEVPFATLVWSGGLAPVKFFDGACIEMERGRAVVDDYLRLPGEKGRIFALGDCATVKNNSHIATASVAEQQAYYLGDCFNDYYSKLDLLEVEEGEDLPLPGPVYPALMPWAPAEFMNKILCDSSPKFQYKNRGSMAVMGSGGGVADLTHTELPIVKTKLSGFAAFVIWRTTYLTKQLSWSNMMLIPMYWFKTWVFGRDISRF